MCLCGHFVKMNFLYLSWSGNALGPHVHQEDWVSLLKLLTPEQVEDWRTDGWTLEGMAFIWIFLTANVFHFAALHFKWALAQRWWSFCLICSFLHSVEPLPAFPLEISSLSESNMFHPQSSLWKFPIHLTCSRLLLLLVLSPNFFELCCFHTIQNDLFFCKSVQFISLNIQYVHSEENRFMRFVNYCILLFLNW